MTRKYWLPNPEPHDFPAALDYLELHFPPNAAAQLVAALKRAPTIIKKAKDVLRASRLPLLDPSNIHVKENLRKVRKGKKMSPVLLVATGGRLIIADGYHRMCAIYELSEDLEIPCRLVHCSGAVSPRRSRIIGA
jgi:hypothetical protein